MKINREVATLDGLDRDYSGTEDTRRLRKAGWEQVPVVRFGDVDYAILWSDAPHPGHNTAEVINVSDSESSDFPIVVSTAQRRKHTEGWAWVAYFDEGMSVLTEYNGELYDYVKPLTAVLSYRIEPPSKDDIREVEDMLDYELQEYGVQW
jgi:hypothetical protein